MSDISLRIANNFFFKLNKINKSIKSEFSEFFSENERKVTAVLLVDDVYL